MKDQTLRQGRGPGRGFSQGDALSPRLSVVSRVLAATLGAYALASFFSTTVALLVGAPREEAANLGNVPAFLVFAGAILWSFAARTALRAWLGVLVPLLVFALCTYWLRQPVAP